MSSALSIHWWLMPLSGATDHHLPDWAVWHARCMVAAWGILLPLGALVARFFKVTPRQSWPQQLDNRAWWHAHQGIQYLGVALMLLGIYLSWNQSMSATTATVWHTRLGWLVVALGATQVLSAWLRGSKGGPTEPTLRGDHYDMTPHRLWFERLHKSLGWLSVLLAVVTLVIGLVIADAPRWMLALLGLWWLSLGVLAIHWQRSGRCIDTYQAIWGPSAEHPGNQRTPIGWGVVRPLNQKQS